MDLITTQLGRFAATGKGFITRGLPGSHNATITVTGAGAVAATVVIRGGNSQAAMLPIATINASGTNSAAASRAWSDDYQFWEAEVTAMSGAGVVVSVDCVSEVGEGSGGGVVAVVDEPVSPTNAYRLRLIVEDIPGVAVDSGGRGFNARPGAQNTAFRANAGAISTTTATTAQDGTIRVAPQMLDWDLQTQSLIFSCRIRGAAPAADQRIIGNASSPAVPGFAIAASVAGGIQFRVSDGTNGFSGSYTSRAALDNNWHHIIVMIDGSTRVGYIWIDDDVKASAIAITGITGSTRNLTSDFRFGNAGSLTPTATLALQIADVQILVVDGPLPTRLNRVRKLLQDNPAALITSDEIPNRVISASDAVVPITPNANAQTRSLYRYFKSFTGKEEFLFGAHDRFDDASFAPNSMGYLDIYSRISGGKAPSIMQWEYVDSDQPADLTPTTGAVRQPLLIQAIRDFAARGGINFVHDHPGNPVTSSLARSMVPNAATGGSDAGSAWDQTGSPLATIDTGGANEAQFLAYLDRMADFFNACGVPIVYRPFHEMNGNWFWWGGASRAATMRNVWIKMVDYLGNTKGVTNVLFCWNMMTTNTSGQITDNATQAYSQWWPGDNYVDIVSADYYNEWQWGISGANWSLTRNVLRDGMDALNTLAAPGGKPVIFAEVGYPTASPNLPYLWDLVGADMSSSFRDVSALMLWRAPWGPDESHASAPSLRTLMEQDYCITLDKMDGKAYTS